MRVWQSLAGEQAPDPCRRLKFIQAFERLLLMSTAGAFFFALTRNIPLHVKELHWPPVWEDTADRTLRYMYLIWFLAYFFVSSVNHDLSLESREFKDILFDLGQTCVALITAYFLGFVIRPEHSTLTAVTVANAGILLICVVSWYAFREEKGPLRFLRPLGAALSTAALGLLYFLGKGIVTLGLLILIQGALFVLWYALLQYRLALPAVPVPAVEPEAPACA